MSDDTHRSEAGQKNLRNPNKPLVEGQKRTTKVYRASKKKAEKEKRIRNEAKKSNRDREINILDSKAPIEDDIQEEWQERERIAKQLGIPLDDPHFWRKEEEERRRRKKEWMKRIKETPLFDDDGRTSNVWGKNINPKAERMKKKWYLPAFIQSLYGGRKQKRKTRRHKKRRRRRKSTRKKQKHRLHITGRKKKTRKRIRGVK